MLTTTDLQPYLDSALESTNFASLGDKYEGKVRDVYVQSANARRILIATDRQSAFDINWCIIPLKGQVLNQLSTWWFKQIEDIMPTHIIETPDENATICKDLQILPIEVVVRAYNTGSSKTAVWTNYKEGVRRFCGNDLPDGMVKNQAFEAAIVTPTTKGEDDELIDTEGILERSLATAEQWEEMQAKALELFARGQKLAAERGLILVDTKYEMGVDNDGVIHIADEVHTPDSSRYWVADSYQERFDRGDEPESLDKEFFRLWLRSQGFEYGDKSTWPEITDDVRLMLAAKYIDLYERMTGTDFVLPENPNTLERIEQNLAPYML